MAVSNPVVTNLKKAKALISDPKHWIKYHYATNRRRALRSPHSSEAVCFCSIGAIGAAKGISGGEAERSDEARYLGRALPTIFRGNVVAFNDMLNTFHSEVMEAFDKAIKLAKKELK